MSEELRCSNCKQSRPVERFRHDRSSKRGYDYMCKDCRRDYYREELHHKIKDKPWFREMKRRKKARAIANYPEKYRARYAVANAVKRNKIVKPSECSKCGVADTVIHGHHPDYSKPLEVIWLCVNCHLNAHKELAYAKS